jgi:predicted 3-demethylubiquinone-9 3-methyltransferase (glyoxalase superfamily)
VSLFEGSGIDRISRYGKAGYEFHKKPEGSVMTVAFHLAGQSFTAMNGGPMFKLSEAVSFQVACDTQAEIDRLWDALIADGGSPSQCGWLKDRFGLSWQILPSKLGEMMSDADPARVGRVAEAFMQMSKFDLATIDRAYRGD